MSEDLKRGVVTTRDDGRVFHMELIMLRGTNPRSEMRGSTTTRAVSKCSGSNCKGKSDSSKRERQNGNGSEEDDRDR